MSTNMLRLTKNGENLLKSEVDQFEKRYYPKSCAQAAINYVNAAKVYYIANMEAENGDVDEGYGKPNTARSALPKAIADFNTAKTKWMDSKCKK